MGLLQHRASAKLMEESATEVVHNIYGGHTYAAPLQKQPSTLSRMTTTSLETDRSPDVGGPRPLSSTAPASLTSHVLDVAQVDLRE